MPSIELRPIEGIPENYAFPEGGNVTAYKDYFLGMPKCSLF